MDERLARPGPRDPRTRRSSEPRLSRLVRSSGKPKAELASELGVAGETLRKSPKQADRAAS
jgi:hypothetical protein